MESGDKNFETLVGQLASVLTLVAQGNRPVKDVGRMLQRVNDRTDFASVLDAPHQAQLVPGFPPDRWVPTWEQFYRDLSGVRVNLLPALKAAPEAPPEFGWPVFSVPEVGVNRTWGECRNLFPAQSHLGDDLERAVPTSDRTAANGSYLVRFRNRVEADEEYKNVSANQLAERGGKYITLHERLLLEQFVWWMTGGFHLDLLNVTLCAGSRDRDGNVLRADWRVSQFRVYCYDPYRQGGHFRTRVAV